MGEPHLAVVGLEDGECGGKTTETARFGVVLERDEDSLRTVVAEQGEGDAQRTLRTGQILGELGELVGHRLTGRVRAGQPRMVWGRCHDRTGFRDCARRLSGQRLQGVEQVQVDTGALAQRGVLHHVGHVDQLGQDVDADIPHGRRQRLGRLQRHARVRDACADPPGRTGDQPLCDVRVMPDVARERLGLAAVAREQRSPEFG
jgi:hypothetical protein